jgi:hypothetical protein
MAEDFSAANARNVLAAIRNLRRYADATDKAIPGAADAIAQGLRNEIVSTLSRPGTGRLYRRRSVSHRASSPGSPPAVDTGSYRASWRAWTEGASPRVIAAVGTGDKRGPWLEHGTSRMAARPHVRPAFAAFVSSIAGLTVAEIARRQRNVRPESAGE